MTNFEKELDRILSKYNDYMECEEYHIHDSTNEHEGETELPHDFDDDQFKQAILSLHQAEVTEARIDELEGHIEQNSPGAGGISMTRQEVTDRIASLKQLKGKG